VLSWLLHALDPVQATCSNWCLHFWEVVGVWFTGLATFAAVVVSLALARREGVRISVSAGHRLAMGAGLEPPFPERLVISVRNVGTRAATIEGVGWRRRPWGKLHGYQQFEPTAGYPGPPATVEPGDARDFSLPLDDTRIQWGKYFVRDFVGRWPRVAVHLIRVMAWTPSGTRCSAFLEPSLKQWLVARAESMPPEVPRQEPSDPILKETLTALRPHLHPEWGDRDEMDVFNRLVAKQIKPKGWTPNTHMDLRLEQISSRRDQWGVDRLSQLPRSHRGTAGPATRLDGPIVIVEIQGSMRVLDGSHRINTWVARGDSAQHTVHIHALKGTANFFELPAKPR
jgi:hypothetical protein